MDWYLYGMKHLFLIHAFIANISAHLESCNHSQRRQPWSQVTQDQYTNDKSLAGSWRNWKSKFPNLSLLISWSSSLYAISCCKIQWLQIESFRDLLLRSGFSVIGNPQPLYYKDIAMWEQQTQIIISSPRFECERARVHGFTYMGTGQIDLHMERGGIKWRIQEIESFSH